jgi:hypothetical protein
MEVDSKRILKPAESQVYYHELDGPKIKILDVKLSNKTIFIRVINGNGKAFDSVIN